MKKKSILVAGMCTILVAAIIVFIVIVSGLQSPFEKQLELAYKYLSEGNYEEAILAFDKAIEIDNRNLSARVAKANVLIETGDESGAGDTIGGMGGVENPSDDGDAERPQGYPGVWYTLEELVEWYLNYNVANGKESLNEPFIDAIEKWGLNLYEREVAPVADKESDTYGEEFIANLSADGKDIYYSFESENVTYKSAKYEAGIRVLEGTTIIYAATADELYVSSETLKLEYTVELPELNYDEDWRFDGYEPEYPYYELERRYVSGEPTEDTRRTGRIKPEDNESTAEDENDNEASDDASNDENENDNNANTGATNDGNGNDNGADTDTSNGGNGNNNGTNTGVTNSDNGNDNDTNTDISNNSNANVNSGISEEKAIEIAKEFLYNRDARIGLDEVHHFEFVEQNKDNSIYWIEFFTQDRALYEAGVGEGAGEGVYVNKSTGEVMFIYRGGNAITDEGERFLKEHNFR